MSNQSPMAAVVVNWPPFRGPLTACHPHQVIDRTCCALCRTPARARCRLPAGNKVAGLTGNKVAGLKWLISPPFIGATFLPFH
jgi:hypothetical protein